MNKVSSHSHFWNRRLADLNRQEMLMHIREDRQIFKWPYMPVFSTLKVNSTIHVFGIGNCMLANKTKTTNSVNSVSV